MNDIDLNSIFIEQKSRHNLKKHLNCAEFEVNKVIWLTKTILHNEKC